MQRATRDQSDVFRLRPSGLEEVVFSIGTVEITSLRSRFLIISDARDTIPLMAPTFGCEAAVRRLFKVNQLTLRALGWGAAGRPGLCFLHGGSAHAHWFDAVAPAF